MPIEFRSGLPGASKTLGAVDHLMQLRKLSPERPVYVIGVNDLRPGLANELTEDGLKNWEQLPANSIIMVDECQRYMPSRRSGEPPAWIRSLSTHRHLGLDFILISQHPALIDTYVRRLIDRHIHHVRKFGTEFCDRWEWAECQAEPTSGSAKKSAHSRTVWKFSKDAMQAYKSAEVHTVKRRIPRAIWVGAAMLIVVPVMLGLGYWRMRSLGNSAVVSEPSASSGILSGTPVSGANQSSGSTSKKSLSRAEWIEQQMPRVAGIPWSAPVFDQQQPQTAPDLFCASVVHDDGDGSEACQCVTEQGTAFPVPGAQCLKMAKEGVYNPYRRSLNGNSSSPASVAQSGPPQAQPVSVQTDHMASSDPSQSQARERATASAYVPPTYGNWNPDPWGSAGSK
ncbi:zonular occludens toxin domain-containing protein [Dyella sp.]|uniref:zonular occludens toxin domain-containing protein n=1 Tax=Dyella sp. TaxID=1869338 RepID=UPI00283E0789|nr:zonular occludens toxin domain-containing protein [Dyella sp.]MDR3445150.1 zonular occludens toxin domain-containing protein [Dyella sp.]